MDDCKLEENDDALERALNKARKLKQREQVANELINTVVGNLKSEESDEEVVDNTNSIVLNSTAEFCRTLGNYLEHFAIDLNLFNIIIQVTYPRTVVLETEKKAKICSTSKKN